MRKIKAAIFAYNFPHKKTQDFLLRAFLDEVNVDVVIAADPVKLNIPPSAIRSKLRHQALVHPAQIAERLGIDYVVLPHNSEEVVRLVSSRGVELGIIAGARIIKSPAIDAFPIGIINFHPGLIPEARGLDAMLWSIHNDIPVGVTAHLIDRHMDAGRILLKQTIAIMADDTLLDLSERLYEQQLDMIAPAMDKALAGEWEPVDHNTPHNTKMPPELEVAVIRDELPEYIQRHIST